MLSSGGRPPDLLPHSRREGVGASAAKLVQDTAVEARLAKIVRSDHDRYEYNHMLSLLTEYQSILVCDYQTFWQDCKAAA